MKRMRNSLILINLFAFIWLFNSSVFHNEKLIDEAKMVYFELAPVDPRSLMQGDYMRLNYAITNEINTEEIAVTGYLVFSLDSNNVAKFERLEQDFAKVGAHELSIRYHLGKRFRLSSLKIVKIGAESYFFQEGKAEKFEKAKYGGLKIDDKGKSILIGLYDADFQKL
jgi:uncharacterized membrane-anchored protein